jgi:replicative DNA helicase
MKNSKNQINEILSNPFIANNVKYLLLKNTILEQNSTKKDILDLSVKVGDLFDQYVENYNNPNTVNETTIKTGFENIDNKLYGFNLGELVVIAAEEVMDKTQFMVNLVTNFAQKHNTLYFSTYDYKSKSTILKRFIACYTGIATNKLKKNVLSEAERSKLIACKSKIQDLKVFINDDNNISLNSFTNLCIDAITKKDVKIIIIDSINFLPYKRYSYKLSEKIKYIYNRNHEVAIAMKELKSLARVYNVCIFALSPILIRRGREKISDDIANDERPKISDLNKIPNLATLADKVIFLCRPDYYKIKEDGEGNSLVI